MEERNENSVLWKNCRVHCVIFGFSGFSPIAEESIIESNRCHLETSVWMIANLFPDSADFYQLSLGYQLDDKNVLFLNELTWKYSAPLGIPFGPDFESPDEEYPGFVRAFGLGLGYKRFFWKGLYSTLYVTPFAQNFYSDNEKSIDSGFQLFLQLQTGYQINFFKGRLYIKPALSFNYWRFKTPSSYGIYFTLCLECLALISVTQTN